MTPQSRWLDAALSTAARLPILDRLRRGTRNGLLLGGLAGVLLGLITGAILGALNRGPFGALVGSLSSAAGGLLLGTCLGAIVGPYYFYDNDTALVTIRLDESDGIYAPGEEIVGHVLLTGHRTLHLEGGRVHFVCRGFRAYDTLAGQQAEAPRIVHETRHYLTEQAQVIPARTIRAGTMLRYPFQFTIPEEALPTHHGNVCSIRWTLHAHVNAARMPQLRANREILVVSLPPAIPHVTGEYRSIASSSVCQMILSLPRVLCAPGETIRARLRITPKQSFAADEIRAVLLRVENIPAGEDHQVYVAEWDPGAGVFRGERREGGNGTTYIWLEDEAPLAEYVSVRTTDSPTFAFSLRIPEAWCPTLHAGDGRVVWKVGVVISRPVHSDLRAFHEVIVCTQDRRHQQTRGREGPPTTHIRRVNHY